MPYYDAIGSRAVLHDRAQWVVQLIAQLAPGASLAQARAEFATLSAQLEAAYPVENKNRHVRRWPRTRRRPCCRLDQMVPRFLALFSIITAITLLVVSANVANLMLARAVARQRETAVRQSLGASRARIVRMLLAEGVAVSFVAWIAAFVMAWWTSKALVRDRRADPAGASPRLHVRLGRRRVRLRVGDGGDAGILDRPGVADLASATLALAQGR